MPSFLAILAGVVAIAALSIYFFGIPPELKRQLERKALQTMGENKASYLVKCELSASSLLAPLSEAIIHRILY